jgi:hypothetical protein
MMQNGFLTDMMMEYVDCYVSQPEALQLLKTFENDEIHNIALQVKGRSLFSEKITAEEMEIGSVDLLDRPHLTDIEVILEDYYLPAIQDGLRPAWALGYIVSSMVTVEDPRFSNKGMLVPQITPREDYDLIERKWKDGRIEWLIKIMGEDAPSDRHTVFFIPFCKPTRGKHNSVISPTMKHSIWISQLFEMQVRAHKQRSHPPYVIEALPVNSSGGTSDIVVTSDPLLTSNSELDNRERLVRGFDQMTMMQSLQQSFGGGMGAAMKHERGEDDLLSDPHGNDYKRGRFEQTVVDNLHYLPHGFKAASSQPPAAEAQKDLLNYHADFKEHALALHGIPPSIVLCGARNNSKTTTNMIDDNDFIFFQRTLRIDAKWICQWIQQMYMLSYPIRPIRADLKFYLKMVPFASPSAIQRMFEQNIIHKDAHKGHLIALNGLMYSDMATDENEILRPPQGGNENQTTADMKSKIEIRKTEQRKILAEAKILEQQLNGEGGEGEKMKTEKKIMELKIELEKIKIEGQLEIIKAQLEAAKQHAEVEKTRMNIQGEADQEKLKRDKERAKLQKTKKAT